MFSSKIIRTISLGKIMNVVNVTFHICLDNILNSRYFSWEKRLLQTYSITIKKQCPLASGELPVKHAVHINLAHNIFLLKMTQKDVYTDSLAVLSLDKTPEKGDQVTLHFLKEKDCLKGVLCFPSHADSHTAVYPTNVQVTLKEL